MKNWRTEYKILLFIGIIFLIILILYLAKTDFIGKVTLNQKKRKLVDCTSQTQTNGIKYTDYTCIIKDERGNNYIISYPQIEEQHDDIKKLNKNLKEEFNEVYNSIKYNKEDQKLQFASYQKINYKIYNSSGIVSFLVEKEDYTGKILNSINQYKIYNIDLSTYKILDNNSLKEKIGIDRDYSSNLRGMIVKMYLSEFRYDYNNELPVYRNQYIDSSVEDVTYSAIDNIYLDDNNNIRFILYLFNPNYGERIPYDFTLDKNGKTSYKPIGYN